MIHSFRPNKDTLLFNIKNIPLHLFNFIFICLQMRGCYTFINTFAKRKLYTLLYKDFKVLLYLKNGIQSGHSLVFLQ